MNIVKSSKLEYKNGTYNVIIYLDSFDTEFSDELGKITTNEKQSIKDNILKHIKEKYPNIKVTAAKIMIGSILISTIPLGANVMASSQINNQDQFINYTVKSGDSLWTISKQFDVNVADIKNINNLSQDTIYINQNLKIPNNNANTFIYDVKSGDTLYKIALKFNTTVDSIKKLNQMTNDRIYVGQNLTISNTEFLKEEESLYTYEVKSGDTLYKIASNNNTTVSHIKSINNLINDTIYTGQKLMIPSGETQVQPDSYIVKSGDSLWSIASKFNVSISNLKISNNLSTETILIGQVLRIPKGVQEYTKPTITYNTYTVKSGDNIWSISIDHGIPMTELLKVNGLTQNSSLSIGQELSIPIHHIPVKPTMGPQYGESLDWWTEAQYVIPINKVFKVIDFETGKSFYIKRTIGANHADCEPLNSSDTNIAKDIWGGYSWVTRSVIIEVDGRRIAASMSYMPHSIQYIENNNFDGHFDIHFLNSTRHKDGQIDPRHQDMIEVSAGISV